MPSKSETKQQLIDKLIEIEDTKYDLLKSELGLPYHTDEEWLDFILRLQTQNKQLQTTNNKLQELAHGHPTTRAPR